MWLRLIPRYLKEPLKYRFYLSSEQPFHLIQYLLVVHLGEISRFCSNDQVANARKLQTNVAGIFIKLIKDILISMTWMTHS